MPNLAVLFNRLTSLYRLTCGSKAKLVGSPSSLVQLSAKLHVGHPSLYWNMAKYLARVPQSENFFFKQVNYFAFTLYLILLLF